MSKVKQFEETIVFGTQIGKVRSFDVKENRLPVFIQKIADIVFARFLLNGNEPPEQYKAFCLDFSKMDKLMLYFNGKISRTRLFVPV